VTLNTAPLARERDGMAIRKAEKQQAKLRLAIIGPSGSGKTYTALAIGSALAKLAGTKMGVVDTERNSACLYSDSFEFDVEADMHSFNPKVYVEKMAEFAALGYGVLCIDSLSHAWTGRDGALEMVDRAATRNGGGNKFAGWRDVTPLHNQMVDAILGYPGHVIVTMRSKMEYVQEKDERGKTVIRKVGLQPVQRDGMEYEFSVVGDMDQDHRLIVTKSRCSALADGMFVKPGKDFAELLHQWLTSGVSPDATAPTISADPEADDAFREQLDQCFKAAGFDVPEADACIMAVLGKKRVANITDLSANDRAQFIKYVESGQADKYKAPVTAGK